MVSDLASLREDCELASMLWRRQAGGLQLIVLREFGADALVRFKHAMLGSHQRRHYLEGIRKLGIRDSAPAVIAGKYHYLSNLIGGSQVEYVEETPKKVWIRYVGEDPWNDGSALIAYPPAAQRATFAAWHGQNADLMGNRRLGYVCTKVRPDGEPYNEGYFIEYDRDIAPDEAVRFEAVDRSPAFDPERAPRLDPKLWPEERIVRARRKYAGAYLRTHVETMRDRYGLDETCGLVRQTMAMLAVQNARRLFERLGVAQTGFAGALEFLRRLLSCRGEDFTVATPAADRARFTLRSDRPFDDAAPEELRQALFAFQAMCVRLLGGTILITRRREKANGAPDTEVWEIEDTHRWLY